MMISSHILPSSSPNLNQDQQQPGSVYARYYKARYHSDPEFKAKHAEITKQWRQKLKEERYEDFAEMNRKKSNKCYRNNSEYREKQKERALARYYRIKQEKLMVTCSNAIIATA